MLNSLFRLSVARFAFFPSISSKQQPAQYRRIELLRYTQSQYFKFMKRQPEKNVLVVFFSANLFLRLSVGTISELLELGRFFVIFSFSDFSLWQIDCLSLDFHCWNVINFTNHYKYCIRHPQNSLWIFGYFPHNNRNEFLFFFFNLLAKSKSNSKLLLFFHTIHTKITQFQIETRAKKKIFF